MVDVVTEFVSKGLLCELLYAADLVMMSVTIEGLRSKLIKFHVGFCEQGLEC